MRTRKAMIRYILDQTYITTEELETMTDEEITKIYKEEREANQEDINFAKGL